MAETNLKVLLTNMEPILNDGEYVFVTVSDTSSIPRHIVLCEMKEKEGVTIILKKTDADALGLTYSFTAAWITLNVHSSLEAIGLTAAFATELSNHNISCNVVAGYYHDHIFVGTEDASKALLVLRNMSSDQSNRADEI